MVVNLRLIIIGGGEQARAVELVEPVISIGSEGTIQLPDPAIAKLALTLRKGKDGRYVAEPGEGWVQRNGTRFTAATVLAANDVFRIGPFRLTVDARKTPPITAQPPAVAAAPAQLSDAAREALVADAHARMAWGEDTAAVEKKLVSRGLPRQEANAIVGRMEKIERTQTRVRGVLQIFGSVILACIGMLITMYYSHFLSDGFAALVDRLGFPTSSQTHATWREIIFGPLLILIAISTLVHGIFRLSLGRREHYEIGD